MTPNRIFRFVALLPALLLAGGAVLAECPVDMSDSADGVYVSFADVFVRYDRLADGSVLEHEVSQADGLGFRVHSISGAFVLTTWSTRFGAIVTGTTETTDYAVGLEGLPTLFPGQTWEGSSLRQHDDGTTKVETVVVTMSPERSMIIGACRYQSWPMQVATTGNDGATFVDHLTYLPSLGFAIYHGGADANEAFTPEMPTRISTEPPVVTEDGEPVMTGAGAGVLPGNPAPAEPPRAPQPPVDDDK